MLKTEECERGDCLIDSPFGQEWEKELMKWSKKNLIAWIKKLLKAKDDNKEIVAVRGYLLKYGQDLQITTAMEELGELISALNQHFFRGKADKMAVVKEIADVEIMCQSLRMIVGTELVEAEKERRIERMLNFLKKGCGND